MKLKWIFTIIDNLIVYPKKLIFVYTWLNNKLFFVKLIFYYYFKFIIFFLKIINKIFFFHIPLYLINYYTNLIIPIILKYSIQMLYLSNKKQNLYIIKT